jgi:hypothetical protein
VKFDHAMMIEADFQPQLLGPCACVLSCETAVRMVVVLGWGVGSPSPTASPDSKLAEREEWDTASMM